MNPVNDIKESVCPVCGKIFIAAPLHVYKLADHGKRVCSWSCLCKGRTKHEAKSRKSKAVLKVDSENNIAKRYASIKEAAEKNERLPATIAARIKNGTVDRDGCRFIFEGDQKSGLL